ncbi:recQ-mediated genome instability protein 2-like [Actinia tenebrosa]|uniref:RecQ-mediated genome instability protein 2-like n=1 Tax=Actinia tenebrosa TaxID=6105 RepID=A0A6P8I1Q2_ACTTE|nr:recQ-mediated genome instability protein 2-like [Actinia tenebrosa]
MSQRPSSISSSHSRLNSGLNSPAKKFFAAQIPSCVQTNKDSSSNNTDEWTYKSNRRSSISFSQIWVQGIVVLVSTDGNDMLIDDGTGIVYVTGLIKLVKNILISKGMYVMVAGQLKSTGSSSTPQSDQPYPTIRILKFSDLSKNLSTEALWMLEVVDAQMNDRKTNA